MRYAVQNDYIESNPAIDMDGALSTVKARHYPLVVFQSFLRALPHIVDEL